MSAPDRIWAVPVYAGRNIVTGTSSKKMASPEDTEYVRADILAEAVEALREIEQGLPAGSSLLDCRDPLWRDAYRELQRIARMALAKLEAKP